MGLLDIFRSAKANAQPSVDEGSHWNFGFPTSKIPATQTTSLTLSAFYNGIDLLTNSIAQPPRGVYYNDGSNKFSDKAHPVHKLISKKPNPLMTSFMFHKVMATYAILKGNGYALIIRNQYNGNIIELRLLDSDHVNVYLYDNQLYYKVKGMDRLLTSDEIIHIPGFSFNGVTGISVIKHAANSLGIALDVQAYGGDVYQKKGMGYGIIESDKQLLPTAKTAISTAVTNSLSSGDSFKVPVLDEGMKYKVINITPQEAEFLANYKHGVTEVARWLNIPPHKLKDLERSTNNNIEHQSIEYTSDSVSPWILRFEQEYDAKLFNDTEMNHYVKFNLSYLLRSDTTATANYLTKLVSLGVMTRNEAREKLELNQLDGLSEPLTPVNTWTPEQIKNNLSNE